MGLLVYLFLLLTVYGCGYVCLSVSTTDCVWQWVCLSICFCYWLCLAVALSVSTTDCVWLWVCLSVCFYYWLCLAVGLFVFLFLLLTVWLWVCLSICFYYWLCLAVGLLVYLFLLLAVSGCGSACLHVSTTDCVWLWVCLFICVYYWLWVCLSICSNAVFFRAVTDYMYVLLMLSSTNWPVWQTPDRNTRSQTRSHKRTRFGDCSSTDDSSTDCSFPGLFIPIIVYNAWYKQFSRWKCSSIQLLFKQRSFHLSSSYLAKNYFINPASN